jgi:two-component system, sensor histidine kinase and response regulator
VLVVEDNALNQQIALELLGMAGVAVDLAENGEQAVRRVQEARYDVVLMDVQMPVMDGLEATRRIRARPGFDKLPILAMTANAMAGDRQRSLAAGMNDHLAKPIDPQEVYVALRRWLPARDAGEGVADSSSRALPPPVDSAAADDPLAAVPGLDSAAGLRRVLGRREAYVGLLRMFTAGRATAPAAIRAALTEGRREDGERAAHSLKGEAGTIGAAGLQEQAAEVEAAIRRGAALPEVEPLLAPMERALEALVAALLRVLPAPDEIAPAAAIDASALRVTVAGLDRLLAEDDMAAVKAFEDAAPALQAAYGKRASDIAELIKGYRFDEALRALREAVAARDA